MNTVTLIILAGVLIAFIIFVAIILFKNLLTPKRIGSIQKLIKDGKYQAAQRTAKAILAKDNHDFLAHYWLGKAYLADNKPELAFMEFKTINERAVFNGDIPEVEFRQQMAALYMKFNENGNALKEYLLLTKMEPQNAENNYNVGRLYELTGQAGLALGFYQKAIVLNKKHSKAHTALGYLLFRSKQFKDAKKEIDLAIKLSPDEFSNYYYLGKILKENKDYSGAIKAFEKSQRDPEFRQRSLIERGSCYMMADQMENAIVEFDHAVKCSRDDASQETLYARYFLAACYEKSHNIEKALEQWEKINQRNKKFKDVPSKLNEYRDLQSNDSMKEYLTAAPAQFEEVCKKAAMAGFKLAAQKIQQTPYGCSMLATEEKKDSWMNVRQQFFLAEFYREADPLEESSIRKIMDTVKAQNYYKAIIFASAGFSPAAIKFAENRPVVLVGKEALENILTKAGV